MAVAGWCASQDMFQSRHIGGLYDICTLITDCSNKKFRDEIFTSDTAFECRAVVGEMLSLSLARIFFEVTMGEGG